MKPFHSIAVPHKDILAGRLTMDVFAADLWEVSQGRGHTEYRDPETFFQKTYLTHGLSNLLGIVENRLSGKGGDPVIQIQTPFGGGKTHALIAMYHRCKAWKAKPVVIVGTAMSSKQTLWGMMEQQITGKIQAFKGMTSPGKEAIRSFLVKHTPVLILMDEVLEYATKAAGERVEQTTLAGQTLAFMQEITEVATTLEKVCVIVTLPASIIEHYDEGAEKLFQQLQKVSGRVEKIYTPVEDSEITKVIRKRLFSSVNETEAKAIVSQFVEYAEKENILPAGVQSTEYRDRFLDSYPFIPNLIDILYQRWGTFPAFQRTRGVLRLLSLLIHSVKDRNIPYITPADYDLSNQEIRQEFIKHIGNEFNGIIAADITDPHSGARKIDSGLGDAYKGLNLGIRTATTIFLYSFSGGAEHGATAADIKRSAALLTHPASAVSEVLEQLKTRLFYLQNPADKYFFNNQPNLNRIILVKMENIKDAEASQEEKELFKGLVGGGKFKLWVWETQPTNIPDTEELKLVVLQKEDNALMQTISTTKGQTPRVNRNTVFFLYPMEPERTAFVRTIKRKMAYERVEKDTKLPLSDEQKKTVKSESKKAQEDAKDFLRRYYRLIAVPSKGNFKIIDMGIPTYGENTPLDTLVYEKLRADREIIERMAPIVIREKYLGQKDVVETLKIYQSTLSTPGEARLTSRNVLEAGIAEGVKMGVFGLGELENGKPVCRYFKESPTVALCEGEILIKDALCKEQRKESQEINEYPKPGKDTDVGKPAKEGMGPGGRGDEGDSSKQVRDKLELNFLAPKGKMSQLMGTFGYLQTKFDRIVINIQADCGKISEQEIEDRIKETFRQLGVDLED